MRALYGCAGVRSLRSVAASVIHYSRQPSIEKDKMPVGQQAMQKKSTASPVDGRPAPRCSAPLKETIDFIFAFYYSLIPAGTGAHGFPIIRYTNQLFRGRQ
ncbi:hypothetical protein [Desulfofustis glycolicus]|uniref:hypothetical protein n=1 Tax=Desulfofustis glycolicus TaxID=51195 RepID=UPI000933CB0D|nr:hypothetical protein [Desulfofustis glycolicus]MCB2216752.1 hypothetical protein [Desulfobulbaceae bacterium]